MANLVKISPEEITDNPFKLIGKDWMLVTAENGGVVNTMTASWGGVGVLWGCPVAFVFIRPQRYTFTLTEKTDKLSLSFFDESYRSALRLCGTTSGKDGDKFKEAGLTVSHTDAGTAYPSEARIVLDCRKLYAAPLEENAFVDPAMLEHYKLKDYHMMYVCKIEAAYKAL